MKTTSLRIRPFNVGGAFEIILPNGRVVLIDPFFTGNDFPGGRSREDVTGADYIILSHTHCDHDIDVGYFCKKFGAKVFCGAQSALELVKYHQIPYDNVFPVHPGQQYTLEDFTVEFFQAKHNPSGSMTYGPENDMAKRTLGIDGHFGCDVWGYLESLDFLITTNNNFRILNASGRVIWSELFETCKARRPNMLLRQAGVRRVGGTADGEQVSSAELAQLMVRYGAQVILPFHHEVLVNRWGAEKTSAYLDEVAEAVRRLDPGACFINPKAWAWYDISLDITVGEG